MTSTSTAEMVICAMLAIPTIYILIKHGMIGLLGWLYLFVFCSLRVVGGALEIKGGKSASTISNVGLSPLILAACGILHEARVYLGVTFQKKIEWLLVLVFHAFVGGALGILCSSGSALSNSSSATTHDLHMLKVGIALLMIAWLIGIAWSILTLVKSGSAVPKGSSASGRKLLIAVLLAQIFIGVRVIYTLVAMTTLKPSLSPVNGTLAVRVVLVMLPELITTIIFVVNGILTRNVKHEGKILRQDAELS